MLLTVLGRPIGEYNVPALQSDYPKCYNYLAEPGVSCTIKGTAKMSIRFEDSYKPIVLNSYMYLPFDHLW